MADFWLPLTISNLCVSTLLALIALGVERRGRHPALAHLLWLLVLVKLMTPPVFTMPLIPIASSASGSAAELEHALNGSEFGEPVAGAGPIDGTRHRLANIVQGAVPAAAVVWAVGSVVICGWSLRRLIRFHRLVIRSSQAAPNAVDELASSLAVPYGLRRVPTIQVCAAAVTPFVWWMGGRTRVVLPERVVERLSAAELRMVLAHEFAHVRRRDHWVRWLEWATCVAYWWNPVAWWARRRLRVQEELGCDHVVLERSSAEPRDYATSLVTVAECLSAADLRPPAVASAMSLGGDLERRLTMILSNQLPKTPRWLMAAVFLIGASVLPLSIAHAQDFEAIERRLGRAVEAGEISLDQAKVMMDALRRTARDRAEQSSSLEEKKRRFEAIQERVKIAVERGDLSREDAEKRLAGAKKELFGERAATASEDGRKQRWVELETRVKAAVERGEVSPEAAKKKLAAAKKELFGEEAKPKSEEALRQQYEETVAWAKAAVERGEITQAEAEKKLVEAQNKLRGGSKKAAERKVRVEKEQASQRDLEERKRRYLEVQRKVQSAVESGEITKEQAERKLIELRKELFGSDR